MTNKVVPVLFFLHVMSTLAFIPRSRLWHNAVASPILQQSMSSEKPSIDTQCLTPAAKLNKAYQQILEQVLSLPQMKDKSLVHLAVAGSRSKKLAANDSDYDVKVVILHSSADYLLQKVTPSQRFKTTINDPTTGELAEVEGNLVDFLTMQKYTLTSNAAAYEALFGIAVYETSQSQYLQHLFYKAYNPTIMVGSFKGILDNEQRKANRQELTGYIKYVANMVYYASAVLTFNSSSEPLQPDALVLLEQLTLKEELKQQIKELYRDRQVNKTRTDVSQEPCRGLLEAASNLESEKVPTSANVLEALQGEGNEFFLQLVSQRRDT